MTASAKTLRFQRRFVNDGAVTGQPTLFAELGRVTVRVDLSDLSEDPVTLNALRMEDIAKANRNELDNAFIARAASVTTATVHRTSDPFTRQGSDLILRASRLLWPKPLLRRNTLRQLRCLPRLQVGRADAFARALVAHFPQVEAELTARLGSGRS